LVSDIPGGDGNVANFFLQCIKMRVAKRLAKSMVQVAAPTSPGKSWGGVEVQLLQEVATKLNFRLIKAANCGKDYKG
jgi:hypothetical protein